MLPPFMIDGRNTAEVFLSNMDYAQVGAAVVVQEIIDGNQNDYLAIVQNKYPDRFFCMGMLTDLSTKEDLAQQVNALSKTFRGIAIPGHRIMSATRTEIPWPWMGQYMNHLPSRSMTCSAHAPLLELYHLKSPSDATAP